jgi:hypothetical protein
VLKMMEPDERATVPNAVDPSYIVTLPVKGDEELAHELKLTVKLTSCP